MRYHTSPLEDKVSYLIGQCLRDKKEAKRMFDDLIAKDKRKIGMFTGSIDLSREEHAEFVRRFSAEIEPTLWESSFRKH